MSRLFTPEEVDLLIPRLDLILGQVYAQLADLVTVRKVLEQAGLPPVPEQLALVEPPPELKDTTRRYTNLIQQVAGDLREIGALGGLVKDLELGLVDFPAVHEGKPVYLCWRYGERVVGYYHDRTSGFRGRKPLGPGRAAIAAAVPN